MLIALLIMLLIIKLGKGHRYEFKPGYHITHKMDRNSKTQVTYRCPLLKLLSMGNYLETHVFYF